MAGWDRRTILRGIASAGAGSQLLDRTQRSSVATAAGSQENPAELWAHDLSGDDAAGGAATVVGDTVFVGDRSLHAIDAEEGTERWQTDFEVEDSSGGLESPPLDLSPAPCVVNGMVYAASGNGLHAVDPADGHVEWSFSGDGQLTTSPTVAGGTAYVGDGADALHAVDAASGDLEWTFETNGPISTAPCVADGAVFAASEDGTLYAIDAASGSELWSYSTRQTVYAAPTYADGVLYVPDYSSLLAFAPSTGDVLWSVWIGGRPHRCPTVADGRVFVTTRHSLFAIDIEEESVAWDTNLGVDGCVCFAPTVVGDTVVAAKGAHVVGVDVTRGDVRWAQRVGGITGSLTVSDGVVYTSVQSDDNGQILALDAPLSGSSGGSRSRLRTLGHAGDAGDLGSDEPASAPEIDPMAIFTHPYPAPADEPVDVYAVIEGASEATVSATFEYEDDEREVSRELREANDLPQRLVDRVVDVPGTIYVIDDSLPPIEEVGAWVDLTVEAESEDGGTTSVGSYDESIPDASDAIGYYGFDDVVDCLVIEARFGNTDSWSESELEDLDRWELQWERAINRYYGSGRGSMGEVGFGLTFTRDEDDLYEINGRSEYLNLGKGSVFRIMRKIRQQDSFPSDEYDQVIGSHPGRGVGMEGMDVPSGGVYIPQLHGTDLHLWCHELGHVYGYADYYSNGLDVDACLMSDGIPSGVHHPHGTKLSTASRLVEELELTQGFVYDDHGTRDDILDPDPVEFSETEGGTTITVPTLDRFSHGDTVQYVRNHRAVKRDISYLVESRPAVYQRELRGETLLRWASNPEGRGGVLIYRRGQPAQRMGAISLVSEDDTPCLESAGETIEDKIGAFDPTTVRFELDEISDSEATVGIEKNPGNGGSITVAADTTVEVPESVRRLTDAIRGPGTTPAIHLRATDAAGRVTGVTEDGTFVSEIPDAEASGTRANDVEWITVPEDREVTFTATAVTVEQYVQEQLDRGVVGDSEEAAMSASELREALRTDVEFTRTRYGDDPTVVETDVGTWVSDTTVRGDRATVAPAEEAQLDPGPESTGLDLHSIEPTAAAEDEQLVLANDGDEPIELGGWTIENADSDTYELPSGTTIAPGERLTVVSTGVATVEATVSLEADDTIWSDEAGRLTVLDDGGTTRLDVGYDARGVIDYNPDAAEGFTAAPGRVASGGSGGLLDSLSLTELGAVGTLGTAGAYVGAKRFRSDD